MSNDPIFGLLPDPNAHQFVASSEEDKLTRLAEQQLAVGEHLWIVMPVYYLTDEEVANVFHEGTSTVLDETRLAMVTPPGCYLCEQPYTAGAERTVCPGKP